MRAEGGRPNYGFRRVLALLLALTTAAVLWRTGAIESMFKNETRASPDGSSATSSVPTPSSSSNSSNPTVTPPVTLATTPGPINTSFPGLTTFRGNATRSYYGEGPLPTDPVVLWKYPTSGGLCSLSNNLGKTTVWCGTGWTGQPNVIEHEDGTIEVRVGAYDAHYHFLDGLTGDALDGILLLFDVLQIQRRDDIDAVVQKFLHGLCDERPRRLSALLRGIP